MFSYDARSDINFTYWQWKIFDASSAPTNCSVENLASVNFIFIETHRVIAYLEIVLYNLSGGVERANKPKRY